MISARHVRSLALHALVSVGTSGVSVALSAAISDGPSVTTSLWLLGLAWLVPLRIATFVLAGATGSLWRYTSIWDLRNLTAAIASSTLAFALVCRTVTVLQPFPTSALFIDAALLCLVLAGARLVARLRPRRGHHGDVRRVLIFGAGDAGEMIVRDMMRQGGYLPVAFVDDDPGKVGARIHGVPVLGTRDHLSRAIARTRPDEILIAMPSIDQAVRRGVLTTLEPFSLPIRTLPGLHQLMSGRVSVGQIHDLAIDDLLRRHPVGWPLADVQRLVAGRRVLVTGAGGSVGTELCRQIAALSPATLVMMDRYEHGLHALSADVRHLRGARPVIGDVTDRATLDKLFIETRPELVFHAAAYKHVPLMEDHACEAVKNNVVGTRMAVEAASRHGSELFVLISTDKAVRPTSVMGATKRVAELIVQQEGLAARMRCVAVRFGNVLGSNGSVVPTFLAQIRHGGPVTVTDPEVRRFFMLVQEAVHLVLHAAVIAPGGSTAVLDMGEQIRVLELARHVIRLAGFVPDVDIPIVFTGLRPGEKLSEELVGDSERLCPSSVPAISLVENTTARDWDLFHDSLAALQTFARAGDDAMTRVTLSELASLVTEPKRRASVVGPSVA